MKHTVDVELNQYDILEAPNGNFMIVPEDGVIVQLTAAIVDLHHRVSILEGEEVELIRPDKNG